MNQNIKLYKKKVFYKTPKGEERFGYNFYLHVGFALVPVRIPYTTKNGYDEQYNVRKSILTAFAETLPDNMQLPDTAL